MIECTKAIDGLVSAAFGKNMVTISDLKKMMDRFALDPKVSEVAREAFIVSDVDLNRRMLKEFEKKAAAKQEEVVIIFVAKKGPAPFKEMAGVNAILEKPTPEDLSKTTFGIIESITQKNGVVPITGVTDSAKDFVRQEEPVDLDVLTDEFGNPLEFDLNRVVEDEKPQEDTAPIDVPVPTLEEQPVQEEPPVQFDKPEDLVDRIKMCDKVKDINILTRELTATAVIKEMIKSSADYTGIEERLKGLNEKIQAVYLDTTIPEQDKLDKVRALLYDKGYYRTKTNTIIEQRVEELIKTITDRTRECLDKRCQELERAIVNYSSGVKAPLDTARVSSLIDDRANILLEITALREEVQNIYLKVNKFAGDATANILDDSVVRTGSPLIDARLRLAGDTTVPEQTTEIIEKILELSSTKSEEFKEANRKLIILTQKLQTVMNLDKDLIDALTQAVELLQSNNIEDRIVQETLLKKSLRFFVAKEGSGRTVIPYICSKLKSRTNCNVLYVDIAGDSKLADYTESYMSLDDWLGNQYQEQFCAVVGTISNTPEAAQRLLVALTKAADYYRVINVVMSPEQKEIFDILVPDTVCVNYIVDPTSQSLDFFKGYIKETKCENVAQRVIINKCIPSTTSMILEKLDLIMNGDVHVVTVPYEPLITECSLRGVKPYELQVVTEAFREVCKVC